MNSEVFHKFRPFLLRNGFFFQLETGVSGDVDQSLFNKPADHSWVCSTTGDCCGGICGLLDGLFEIFSKGIIGSLGEWDFIVGVESFPLLDNGVNIKNAFGLAINEDVFGRCLNRQVHTESFFISKNAIKHFKVIVLSKTDFFKMNGRVLRSLFKRIYDDKLVISKVSFDHGGNA